LSDLLDGRLLRHRILGREEERLLIERAVTDREAGIDGEAREILLFHHLRLAANLAFRFRGRGVDVEDLFGEAVCGLMAALDHLDVTFTNRFATYATYWVINYLQRVLANSGRTVRVPNHVSRGIRRLKSFQTHYLLEHGRSPTDEEIARELKCKVKWARVYRRELERREISVDGFFRAEHDGDSTRRQLTDPKAVEPSKAAERNELGPYTGAILECLNPRERFVIRMRFGFDGPARSFLWIGARLGVSKQAAQQVADRAMKKLRQHVQAETPQEVSP